VDSPKSGLKKAARLQEGKEKKPPQDRQQKVPPGGQFFRGSAKVRQQEKGGFAKAQAKS